MKEELVSFELAKKLKELGFDWELNNYYFQCTKEHYAIADVGLCHNWNNEDDSWSAPTLSLAQKWFREEKNILVDPAPNSRIDNWRCHIFYWTGLKFVNQGLTLDLFGMQKDTYEEALEKGLLKACELL